MSVPIEQRFAILYSPEDVIDVKEFWWAPDGAPAHAETLDLARRAVESRERRKNEDVREWAARLARDVGHLTD